MMEQKNYKHPDVLATALYVLQIAAKPLSALAIADYMMKEYPLEYMMFSRDLLAQRIYAYLLLPARGAGDLGTTPDGRFFIISEELKGMVQ